MENFTIYNPTAIHFGKDVLRKLPKIAEKYGKKPLLIYGKNSVIKYGYYEQVQKLLQTSGFEIVEYSGIKSNPIIADVEKAVQIGQREKVDFILALGGGSVIDTAKIVALCTLDQLDPWQVVTGKQKPQRSLPIITIQTLAATGTEMNSFAVVQNEKTKQKIGFGHKGMFPAHSFLDPQFTCSVPRNYTIYGISDIIAHAFENFFGGGDSPLADRFSTSVILETMHYSKLLLNDLQNYDYRANILLQSTCALNGINTFGKTGGDWGVHEVGHNLSAMYDTPHGASLSVVYPAWFRLMEKRIPQKIATLAEQIFGTQDFEEFLSRLLHFYRSIETPVSLHEIGIAYTEKERIKKQLVKNSATGNVHKLSEKDYDLLLEYMYNPE